RFHGGACGGCGEARYPLSIHDGYKKAAAMPRPFSCAAWNSAEQQSGQFVRCRGDRAGAGLLKFGTAAEAPQHADAAHMVGHGAVDVEVAVADHHRVGRRAIEVRQRLGDHRGLLAVRAVRVRAVQAQEGFAERQVGDDRGGVPVRLAGHHGKLVAGSEQLPDQCLDARIDFVFLPAQRVEALVVVLHRRLDPFGVVIQQRREAVPQRRADPAAQFLVRRCRHIQPRQRVFHAGGDAVLGIDQGTVEVEQAKHYFAARAFSAVTAGNSLPSRNSRKAPPPVEMYDTLLSMPYLSTAARVSPPPAIENALDAAMARASVSVPLPNASNSNTPTGPFHTTVPALAIISA